ncbi:aspartate aminotransferase, cytoplasmic [Theileria orientalis]|uniref:Aspartate aminotransferase, cytoplasmic n=1 Tax=Theileria orientalis TaxID=68886 RepID=A0A976SL57_THEOR|nr:aspartate aminotransferase, cytoplasmic [Theileria orientalis]
MQFFDDLIFRPLDLNFGPAMLAKEDKHPDKLDLSLGVYRSADGEPFMFDVIKEVRAEIASNPNQLEEYLSLLGNTQLSQASRDLLFKCKDTDEEEYKKLCERICSIHAASATNGIFIGLLFLKHNIKGADRAFTSRPCWVGYPTIVDGTRLEYGEYPYLKKDSTLDIDGMLSYFETLRRGDILLLQVSAHNPCGVDPTRDQWHKIAEVVKRKELIPFLDIAYQGYASGDLEEDSYPIRLFASLGVDLLVAHSFSKMMTIYAGRVGCLHVVMHRNDLDLRERVLSNLRHICRGVHGTPVRLYSEVVYKILTTPSLKERWLVDLGKAYNRIRSARVHLYNKLVEYKVVGNWDHVYNQRGMFCYLNIPEHKVDLLRTRHHIYLISNSRVCVAQLNENRAERLALALKDVLENE